MTRVSAFSLFRAEATGLPWAQIGVRALPVGQHAPDGWLDELKKRTAERNNDVHVWWACSPTLGVPRGPFTVWVGSPSLKQVKDVDFTSSQRGGGLLLRWGGDEAAFIVVDFDPINPNAAVGLFAHRTAATMNDVVAVSTAPAPGPVHVQLVIKCSGATSALLVNGMNAKVRIRTVEDVINDDTWKPIELVGLPCEQPWGATAYDSSDQGLVAAPVPPFEAAVQRLKRGMPPLGWPPMTQTGRLAPDWVDPDPELVVKEVVQSLLPEIAELYDPGVPERLQFTLSNDRAVPGPTQDGRTSALDTSATTQPLAMLALPAQTDPVLNLATGFGTTYTREGRQDGAVVGHQDFLVTADYERTPSPWPDKVTFAAYAPQTGPHEIVPPPTALTAERNGLVPPNPADTPWRESIRVSWNRLPTTAAMGRVGAGTLARYDAGAAQATSLAPKRDADGIRPLTLSPDGAPGTPGSGRVAFVDGAADIPILSGGRQVGYAVSLVDVHGVWSAWRDIAYTGNEPGPLPPRLIALDLASTYAGSPACPATLTLETALDWTERRPTSLQIVALFFPMASASAPPPAGLDPGLPTPAGCFRRDLGLTFAGDVPTGVGATVTSLGPDGANPMAPGPGQGDGGRRYRLTSGVPTLDFTSTQRWGVQVWLRSTLAVGASPTAYTPDTAHPAVTTAASPMPIVPLPPPAPPGVPMGSTPDAQGSSHVRVQWSLPAGGTGVRSCIVWECSETALRQRAGLAPRAPETDSPGVRLAALWAAYDALTPTQQRAAFRRLLTLPGGARDADVTLPKGSTDIHLFTVTTQSETGIESPWPGPAPTGHIHLQAATAPRLRRPTPPLTRVSVAPDGTVTVRLFSASRVPVARFLVYATRSEAAARDHESMGPPVAVVPVVLPAGGPDPVTGAPVYEATWTGTLPPAWDNWLVRAVAKPVDTVPVQAVRGQPSAASEVVSILVPPTGPPDLDPLVASRWGADHRGVVVTSGTSGVARVTSAGVFRLGGVAEAMPVAMTDLPLLPETPGTSAPAGATSSPVLERGPRTAGRLPLRLWIRTPDATAPATVSMRLLDPMGRSVERTVTVPGFVPTPAYTLTIVRTSTVASGVVLAVGTDAPATVSAGISLSVRGVSTDLTPLPLPFPRPRPGLLRVSGTFLLSGVRTGRITFPADGQIHVIRPQRTLGWPREARYAVFVPLVSPVRITLMLLGPAGEQLVTVTGGA